MTDRSFEMELEINATKDAVWNAISTDDGLTRWFSPSATVTPGAGGEIRLTWSSFFDWPQKIEVWEPGARLKTSYPSPVDDGHGSKVPLFVDFQLHGEGGRTTLRVVHSGFGEGAGFDEEYNGISRGWPVEIRMLRLYLESHLGQRRHLAWSAATVPQSPAETWARLVGRDGLDCAQIDQHDEGDAFHIQTPDGDVFEGTTLQAHEREFSGVATNRDRGFFRVWCNSVHGGTHLWIWFAAFGDGREVECGQLQSRWDAMLDRLFEKRVEPVAPKHS